MMVDLYGQCADADAIREICHAYDMALIEDAAEAVGSTYKDRPAGTLGDIGVFSFNGKKIMTISDGGMVLTPTREWNSSHSPKCGDSFLKTAHTPNSHS
jgi:dTDP-4-amino-4,6-dideoxygalactose transaminase